MTDPVPVDFLLLNLLFLKDSFTYFFTFYYIVQPRVQQLGKRFVQLKCPVETLGRNQLHQFIVVCHSCTAVIVSQLPLLLSLFIPSEQCVI